MTIVINRNRGGDSLAPAEGPYFRSFLNDFSAWVSHAVRLCALYVSMRYRLGVPRRCDFIQPGDGFFRHAPALRIPRVNLRGLRLGVSVDGHDLVLGCTFLRQHLPLEVLSPAMASPTCRNVAWGVSPPQMSVTATGPASADISEGSPH